MHHQADTSRVSVRVLRETTSGGVGATTSAASGAADPVGPLHVASFDPGGLARMEAARTAPTATSVLDQYTVDIGTVYCGVTTCLAPARICVA